MVSFLINVASMEAEVDVVGEETPSLSAQLPNGKLPSRTRKPKLPKANGQPGSRSEAHSGIRVPSRDDWELDCEVCQRRGINLVGTSREYTDCLDR